MRGMKMIKLLSVPQQNAREAEVHQAKTRKQIINDMDHFLRNNFDEFDDPAIENPYRVKYNKTKLRFKILCAKGTLTIKEVDEGRKLGLTLAHLKKMSASWSEMRILLEQEGLM